VPMTLARLIGSDAATPKGAESLAIAGLTADSREVKPGFLFAALPGTSVDGAQFIPDAISRGAAAIVSGRAVATDKIPVVATANPRRLFALMAARFFGRQPDLVTAVTGTNGKTSVASFVREIWTAMGFRAASIGTIGVVGPSGSAYLEHTTPDPVKLHETVAELAGDHVNHLSIEASSHGLAQFRLDGLRLAAGAFTNMTRDHLDYHSSFAEYFAAKMRLFEELLPKGAPAVINADSDHAGEVVRRAAARGLEPFTVGTGGTALRLAGVEREGFGQRLEVEMQGTRHAIFLPLAGEFQVSNALVAAGLVIATGGEPMLVMHALESLKGARGRLDLIGHSPAGAPVFVDYAHTPDALKNALLALRPYAAGRLAVVFGCGGDRDRGKRPEMGAVAAKLADIAFVTDDNPRSEDPAAIRKAILAACPGGIEIGNRSTAIATAIRTLGKNDVLLVAGKGHEEGQIVGKAVLPFSDHDAVRAAFAEKDEHG
jgi:UDP-N-acetylmuramoyl-L-alanyl-D-glutamate--2,6-diaminopimelate ligase